MEKVLKKIVDFIVDKRLIFLISFIIIAIASIFLFSKVNVNYDTTVYLEDGSITRETLELMEQEFESSGSFKVMVEDVTIEEAEQIENTLKEVDGVTSIIFDSSDSASYSDKYALYVIYLKYTDFSNEAKESVNLVREALSEYKIYLNGSAVESRFLGDSVQNDMVQILLWACIIVFIILLLNSISWIEPLIFMIVVFIAIIINMGTNALLPSISFVTQSICAVMQLALAMDYSIILLHRYMSERENDKDASNVEIVKRAMRLSIVPIMGSSLTTIAGLLALVCMKFKMGMDIGLVLSKGIVVSLLTVFFFMPAVLIIFSRLIEKTKHRNLYQLIKSKLPTFERKIAKYQYKSRIIVPIVLVVLIVVGFVFYTKTEYAYTLDASNDPNSTINIDDKKIETVFGSQNTVAVLVPHGNIEKQKELVNYLLEYKYENELVFTTVQGISTIKIYEKYSASELSADYNIPLDIVEGVYKEMDPTTNGEARLVLDDVLKYIVSSDYLNKYSTDISKTIEELTKYIEILEKPVTASELSNLIKEISNNSYFSEKNCQALLDDLNITSTYTVKDLIDELVNKEYIDNLLNGYSSYVNKADELKNEFLTREQLKLQFSLSDDDLDLIYGSENSLLFNTIIMKMVTNNLDSKLNDTEKELFSLYKKISDTMDFPLKKEEVLEKSEYHYNIIPTAMYTIIYGVINPATYLTNYEIQSRIIRYGTSQFSEIKEDLIEIQELITLLDKELTVQDVADSFGLNEVIVNSLFSELQCTTITGRTLVERIVSENIISKITSKMGETLDESYELVKYAKKMFESDNYDRIVLNMRYKRSSEESMVVTKNLRTDLTPFYEEYYIASESSAFLDFEETFSTDSLKINLISFLFILIIIAISFRSLSVPVILTVIIQGAIWLTMTISVIEKSEVYFICYLMVICIQMGTTIDYGILYTSKYIEERKKTGILDSLENAFKSSITTILTSGSILIIAAFVVGKISQVSIISSIGYLLSKGSLISVIFILTALPQVLIVSDKLIQKTTFDFKISHNENNIERGKTDE